MIRMLQTIKKNGGDIDTYSISVGIKELSPGDPEFSWKDYAAGFSQRAPDGTFSIVATGVKNKYDVRPSKFAKRPGKKKGEKRSS